MKKILFFSIIAAFAFSACSPYEVTEPVTTASLGKATVNGIAFANTDLTDSDLKFAPVGTKIKFTIDYADFGITGTTGTFAAEAVIGENGEYTISLPAIAAAVTYKISCEEFVTDEIQSSSSNKKIYAVAGAQTLAVQENFTYIKNFTYAAAAIPISTVLNWTETGKFETKLEYIRDENGPTKIEIPAGTEVIVTISKNNLKTENDKVFSVNVGTAGKLVIEHLCPPLTEATNKLPIKIRAAVILPVVKLADTEDTYELYTIPAISSEYDLMAGFTKDDVKSILLTR